MQMKIIERLKNLLSRRMREKQFRCQMDFHRKSDEYLLQILVDDTCSCILNHKNNCSVLKDELRHRGYHFYENGGIKL
ncbi:protein of unknown function [Magnetospirillum sp. XM-1]|nr:protein of unknown function [Magnetospirillum sp. XM-1]